MKTRTNQTLAFLASWFAGCGGVVEGRAFRHPEIERQFFPVDHLEKISAWAARHQEWNVFYGTCPRKNDSSGKESNLQDLPGLWVDFDFKDFEAGGIEVMEIIDSFKHPPSLLVHSGGGIHAYWKFERPVPPTLEFKGQLKGLCRHLRGDPSATDLSRILRLPGTFNNKYEVPLPVVVLRGLD